MSSNVRPASATACSQASMVNDSGGTICRLPIFDMPIPVIAAASSNFSSVSIGRDVLAEVLRCDLVDGLRAGLLLRGGREDRQPDGPDLVLGLLELDLDGLAQLELVGFAVNDVGGQPNPRVLDDRDLRHHIGRREVGEAEPVVDGERRQGWPRPTRRARPCSRLRQYRHTGCGGWISASQSLHSWIRSTPSAPAVQKNSFCALSFWQRSGHRTNSDIASLSSVFGSGSAASLASGCAVPSRDGRMFSPSR